MFLLSGERNTCQIKDLPNAHVYPIGTKPLVKFRRQNPPRWWEKTVYVRRKRLKSPKILENAELARYFTCDFRKKTHEKNLKTRNNAILDQKKKAHDTFCAGTSEMASFLRYLSYLKKYARLFLGGRFECRQPYIYIYIYIYVTLIFCPPGLAKNRTAAKSRATALLRINQPS